MLWEQSLNFFLKWWNSHWRGWEAWKVRASVFTRQQMAAVKKKKAEKERQKGKKRRNLFSLYSLKTVIWDLLSSLSSCSHFPKLGLSSGRGIWDLRWPSPSQQEGIPRNEAGNVMELLGIHPKNGSRSKARLGEGSALWGFAGRRELLLSGSPKTSALSGTCTLKRNLRKQSFISWDLRSFINFFPLVWKVF